MRKKLATAGSLLLSTILLCGCSNGAESSTTSPESSSSSSVVSDSSESTVVEETETTSRYTKSGTVSLVSDIESEIYLSSNFEYIYETDQDGTLGNNAYVFPINDAVFNYFVNSNNEVIRYGTEETNLQSLVNLYKLPDQIEQDYSLDVNLPLFIYPAGVALAGEIDSIPEETITLATIDDVTSMYHESKSGSSTSLRGFESGEYFQNTIDFTDLADLVLLLNTIDFDGFDMSTLQIDWDTLIDHLNNLDSYNDLFSFDLGIDLDENAETIALFYALLEIISAGVETDYSFNFSDFTVTLNMVLKDDALTAAEELLTDYFGDNISVHAESLSFALTFDASNITVSDLNSDFSELITSGALTILGASAEGSFLVTDLINETTIPVDMSMEVITNQNSDSTTELSYLDINLSSEGKYLYWMTLEFDDYATKTEDNQFDYISSKIDLYSPIADEFNAFYEPIEGYIHSASFEPFISKIDITEAGGTTINSYAAQYESLNEEVKYMLSDEVNASSIVAGYNEGRARLEQIPSLYTSSVTTIDDIISLLYIDEVYVNGYLNFAAALQELGASELLGELQTILESIFTALESAYESGIAYALSHTETTLAAIIQALNACISNDDLTDKLPYVLFDDYKERYKTVCLDFVAIREAYYVYFSALAEEITEEIDFESLYTLVNTDEFALLSERYNASSTVSAFSDKSEIIGSVLSDQAKTLMDSASAVYKASSTLEEFNTGIADVESDILRLDLVELYLLGTDATYSSYVTTVISSYRGMFE